MRRANALLHLADRSSMLSPRVTFAASMEGLLLPSSTTAIYSQVFPLCGARIRSRATASSMAKGNPSRRWHISAIAGAFSLSIEKSGLAATARSIVRRENVDEEGVYWFRHTNHSPNDPNNARTARYDVRWKFSFLNYTQHYITPHLY